MGSVVAGDGRVGVGRGWEAASTGGIGRGRDWPRVGAAVSGLEVGGDGHVRGGRGREAAAAGGISRSGIRWWWARSWAAQPCQLQEGLAAAGSGGGGLGRGRRSRVGIGRPRAGAATGGGSRGREEWEDAVRLRLLLLRLQQDPKEGGEYFLVCLFGPSRSLLLLTFFLCETPFLSARRHNDQHGRQCGDYGMIHNDSAGGHHSHD